MGKLKELWNSTIFPDMIKRRREKKEYMRQLRYEATKQAMEELKPELVKVIKQKELDKMTGKKTGKSFMEKLAKGFEMPGGKVDVVGMMGTGRGIGGDVEEKVLGKRNNKSNEEKKTKDVGDDIVEKILGKKTKKRNNKNEKDITSKEETEDFEDKIKRLLE